MDWFLRFALRFQRQALLALMLMVSVGIYIRFSQGMHGADLIVLAVIVALPWVFGGKWYQDLFSWMEQQSVFGLQAGFAMSFLTFLGVLYGEAPLSLLVAAAFVVPFLLTMKIDRALIISRAPVFGLLVVGVTTILLIFSADSASAATGFAEIFNTWKLAAVAGKTFVTTGASFVGAGVAGLGVHECYKSKNGGDGDLGGGAKKIVGGGALAALSQFVEYSAGTSGLTAPTTTP